MNDLPMPRMSGARRPGKPSMATLLDWVEGRLPEDTAEQVATAVEFDPELRETVEWIHAFHAAAAQMPLEAPPPEVSASLHAAFERFTNPGAGGGWSEASPDTSETELPHAAGFRSAGRRDTTHLIFHTAIGDLLLRVSPAGAGTVDVDGRVLLLRSWVDTPVAGMTVGGLEVAAMADGVLHAAVRCESARETFELRGLPVNVDEIWVTYGDERVRAAVNLIGE